MHRSDPKRAHGLRPYLVLYDEPAQVEPGSAEAMIAALRTGLGKTPGSRLIALGTRPADPSHWFATMLRTAAYAQTHAASTDDPPFKASTWAKAKPLRCRSCRASKRSSRRKRWRPGVTAWCSRASRR